ncbi:hypothetical protein CANCADRAFT_14921, partial [Tortispora caseinolytica NRRL Y-17796]
SKMAESRQELIAWVSELLDITINKVEDLGTGAAYCQIIDSIYGDVPMSKVKFNASSEYQYINNYKVLQAAFLKHNIDHPVPVEKLIKCRFQDNLMFLQWIRRYWLDMASGNEYDAVGRRQGAPSVGAAARQPPARAVSAARPAARVPSGSIRHAPRPTSATNGHLASKMPRATAPAGPAVATLRKELDAANEDIARLSEDVESLRESVITMETERNFYFTKLRAVELLIQQLEE